MRRLWEDIEKQRAAAERPLRLELVLSPSDSLDKDAPYEVADVPFELLADKDGFLFRRYGASLIRTIKGFTVRTPEIEKGASVLIAWANPASEQKLPEDLFQRHEASTKSAAEKAGLRVKSPCAKATPTRFEQSLSEGGGTSIVSLIVHGGNRGGSVWLHQDGHEDQVDHPGAPIDGCDLATRLRKSRVEVALLWSCHTGKRHPIAGSVAATLLHHDHGNLAAVVASHAALRANDTDVLAEKLFAAFGGEAQGDLERAVNVARWRSSKVRPHHAPTRSRSTANAAGPSVLGCVRSPAMRARSLTGKP